MASIDSAFFDIGRLDRLAAQDTAIHRLDPRAKLVTTAVFILAVVSFDKYEVSALLPLLVYPVALASAGRIPFGYLLRRILVVAPFAVMVGILNPFLDREVLIRLGALNVTGGWLSFGSILLRFLLTIGIALVLIATTSFQGLCLGLQRLGMPRVLTVQMLFLYRYLFVLGAEAVRLVRARALRSFGRKGQGFRVYASLVGQLLLRTVDRAQRIHLAMLCRGFNGEIHSLKEMHIGSREVAFTVGWIGVFGVMRLWDLPELLGALLSGRLG